MEALYIKVAQLIFECKDVVALTGAGMSAETGLLDSNRCRRIS
jgi:NAD-dependent SIR2 family protein deacetylase